MSEPIKDAGAPASEQPRRSKKPLILGALIGALLGSAWGGSQYNRQDVAAGNYTSVEQWAAAALLWGPLFGLIIGAMVRDWNNKK